MEVKKIIICGGHLAPTLAVIQLLLERKDYKIFYIGRKTTAEGDKAASLEYKTISKLNIPFYSLNSGRLQRHLSWYTFSSLVKFPLALIYSFYCLLKIKPKIVLSFGSYVALPVAVSAWLLGIPVITHEQTHILGLANRIISKFAKVVCLGWSDTKYVSKGVKTIVVGNPVRKDILSPRNCRVVNFGDKKLPFLYVSGGSLGSRSLNRLIGEILSYLTARFRLIHQCGVSKEAADFKLLSRLKNALPLKSTKNYFLVPHIDPFEVGDILHHADLVICRSGANTVTEIAAVGIPAIFIPLPWAAEAEQEYNAKMLEEKECAKILPQEKITSKKLIEAIESIMRDLSRYRKNAQSARGLIKTDAAQLLVGVLDSYIE